MNTKIFTKVVAVSLALCLGFNLTFPEGTISTGKDTGFIVIGCIR